MWFSQDLALFLQGAQLCLLHARALSSHWKPGGCSKPGLCDDVQGGGRKVPSGHSSQARQSPSTTFLQLQHQVLAA